MFERFTDKARTVVISARAEAAERGDQLRPVYMLYALTTGEGVAARALAGLGVDAARVQRELDRPTALGRPLEGLGDEPDSGDAEALAAIGIDLGEIKRRIEDSFGPDALERVPPAPQGPLSWTGRPDRTAAPRRRWPPSVSTWARSSAGSRIASGPTRSSACRRRRRVRSAGPDGRRCPGSQSSRWGSRSSSAGRCSR